MMNVDKKYCSSDSDKPGSLALSVMDEMKTDVFKKPYPVSAVKRKQEVLDEETYLEVCKFF